MTKRLYSELEQHARVFLNDLQEKGGPPIYTLSPDKARAVLSGLQASIPIQKLQLMYRTVPFLVDLIPKRYLSI
jgi:hypothetical protein